LLPDDVHLLKLVWHPLDLDGETVLPTAFRKEDLSGEGDHHVSVDRADRARRASLESVANGQAERARIAEEKDGVDRRKKLAKIGKMLNSSVRDQHVLGLSTFEVRPKPIKGNNAHCGIFNVAGARNPKGKGDRAFFDEARTKLAAIASPAIDFDIALPKRKEFFLIRLLWKIFKR
jgi:hypothetical protein